MTTYSKSQIIDILKAAPEGAQYYTDGYDVKYRKVLGDKYFGYLDEAKGWVETCDKILSQERIDKGWWLFNLAKQLDIPTETTEEKEVLDGIESAGEVEWKNGDLLEFNGEPCVFIGDYNGIPVVRYTENADQSLAGCLDEIYAVDKLKKPETPKQREERERLESAYDLYCHIAKMSNRSPYSFDQFASNSATCYRKEYLEIVCKTNYRKEKTHGTN